MGGGARSGATWGSGGVGERGGIAEVGGDGLEGCREGGG